MGIGDVAIAVNRYQPILAYLGLIVYFHIQCTYLNVKIHFIQSSYLTSLVCVSFCTKTHPSYPLALEPFSGWPVSFDRPSSSPNL